MQNVPLSEHTTPAFAQRFEQFDGAVVLGLELDFGQRECRIRVRAYDTSRAPTPGSSPPDRWVSIRLDVTQWSEFHFFESDKASTSQFDDHLAIVWLDGHVYLVGDPLQSRDFSAEAWTLDQVRRSTWYVGGTHLSWASD